MKTPDAAAEGSGDKDHHRHHRHHHRPNEEDRRHHHHRHTSRSGDPVTSEAMQSDESRALLSGSGNAKPSAVAKSDHQSDDLELLEKRIKEKQSAAAKGDTATRSEPPSRSFEALLERKQQEAAAADKKTAGSYEALLERKHQAASSSAAAAQPPADANREAAALDRRIDAKRAANQVNLDGSALRNPETTARNTGESGEHGTLRDDDLQAYTKSDHDKDTDEFQRGSEDRFNEQGTDNVESYQDAEVYYPNVETDPNIMAEIAEVGLVDEVGGIQAFVADPVVDEANVIGVIKSDEEVEREERREYITFFLKSVACIVFLIIVIGVPVTLKATDVIGKVVVVTQSPTMSPTSMPSESPSSMPSSVGLTEVVERLYPISGDALKEVGSPQHRAARWISDEDPMQLDIYDPGFEQRYVMAVFYYSLDGDNWSSSDGWLSGDSECTWEWVVGPGCLNGCINGKVCGMKFEGWFSNMKGTLPDEMSLLTEMRYFELQGREKDLVGTIPAGIGTNWTKVTAFLVNSNRLTGEFPFVSNPLLGTIFLNRNEIEGDIGSITNLPSLYWLEAEENKFTGTLPDAITEMEYLWRLSLTKNSITGDIPDSWTNASVLESFLLSGNKLIGGLPPTIADAPNLKKLHLAGNMLSGPIPSSYYQMQTLHELYINGNNLGGSLSQVDEPLYLGIREFVINNNTFEGRFPVEQFEGTEILNILALHNNELTGVITDNICQRLNVSNPNARLKELSVDCDLIECTCCTCY